MLTHFVLLQPGVHILDDVRLVLQLVDEALQLGEVSRVVDRLHSAELRETSAWTYIQDSHWSSSYITRLSLDESFRVLKYFHSDASPALLCHKEPARRIQSPLLGALERKIPLGGYFACSSLVLYGIR